MEGTGTAASTTVTQLATQSLLNTCLNSSTQSQQIPQLLRPQVTVTPSLIQRAIQNISNVVPGGQPLTISPAALSAINSLTRAQLPKASTPSTQGQTAQPATSSVPLNPPTSTSNRGSVTRTTPSSINLNVRIINPNKKNQYETYILRNINYQSINTLTELKAELVSQFGSDLVDTDQDFPIGYLRSGSKIRIRNTSDIQDVWNYVQRRDNVSLWRHGVGANKDDTSGSSSDSDSISMKRSKKKKGRRRLSVDSKNKRVDKIVFDLQEKHGTKYTSIQYHIWAEMMDVGTHK